jgi:hypothetical protein
VSDSCERRSKGRSIEFHVARPVLTHARFNPGVRWLTGLVAMSTRGECVRASAAASTRFWITTASNGCVIVGVSLGSRSSACGRFPSHRCLKFAPACTRVRSSAGSSGALLDFSQPMSCRIYHLSADEPHVIAQAGRSRSRNTRRRLSFGALRDAARLRLSPKSAFGSLLDSRS